MDVDTTDETMTENLRQMRDEVNRLFAESLAKLRQAQAANSNYRAALLVAYPAKRDVTDES